MYGEKIGTGLDALGDRPRTMVLRQLDDLATHGLFQPIIRAAGRELMIDLQFDERKVPKSHQVRPLRADIVDYDRNIMQADLFCDIDHEIQIPRSRRCCRSGQQAGKRRMLRQRTVQIADPLPVGQKRNGHVDREIDRPLLLKQVVPILDSAANHEFGEAAKMRIVVVVDEIGGGNHYPRRDAAFAPAPLRRWGRGCGR